MKRSKQLNGISLEAVRAERCKRSFYYFFKEFWGTIEAVELVDNWHLEFICNELQKIYNTWAQGKGQDDIIINVPPGSSKSTICTQLFPVWLWVKNPSIRTISSSYSSDLSTAHAVQSRNCIGSDKFKLYFSKDWQIKAGEDNKTWYKNTKMGERFATSTGGTVTGKHADFIIVDDPINPQQAESVVMRETAIKHMKETLSTRKTDKNRSVTILIMQRLHEGDPTGVLLKQKKINHICLPGMLADNVVPESVREKYDDGLLDKKRLNKEALDKMKVDLGSYGFAGQVGQKPSPEGGGKLKIEWFGKITYTDFVAISEPVNIFIDSAYTKEQRNDPTALMAGKFYNNNWYILDSAQVWKELPDLLKYIPEYSERNLLTNKGKILVEPKASGKSIVQSFRKNDLNVVELEPPVDDKITRVSGISPTCEAGKVFLVEGSWNDNFLGELAAFPNGDHDDQVDNLVNFINYFQKSRKIKMTF